MVIKKKKKSSTIQNLLALNSPPSPHFLFSFSQYLFLYKIRNYYFTIHFSPHFTHLPLPLSLPSKVQPHSTGPFRLSLLLLKLKTKNWKYYSKIIFKCVNSTVGPIFNAWQWWIVIFVSCTVNPCEVTVHAQEKKKSKMWNWKTQQSTQSKHSPQLACS